MKKYALAAILILLPAFYAVAQNNLTADEKTVQQVVNNMFDAIATRDTINLKLQCTADILILESGATWNMDTLIQKISPNPPADFKRINTIDFIDTKISGNTAWTTFNNRADITRNGQRGFIIWLETAILVKERKKWKVKVLHSTLVKRGAL
ncbi:MAG: nuclear transport factor 2 family protein [Ferruginibacter sp.]